MFIATAEIKLYAPWLHSLKEKRMLVRSIVAKVQNRFHIAIAEIGAQDMQQTAILGLAAVSSSKSEAEAVIGRAVAFVESHTEAELLEVRRELR